VITGGPARAATGSLFEFGGDGAKERLWDAGAGAWSPYWDLIDQSGTIDATGYANNSDGLLFIPGFSRVRDYVWDEENSVYVASIRVDAGAASGNPVSAVGNEPGGPLLMVYNTSKLYLWRDSGSGFVAGEIGTVGDDPRRIRLLGDIAVVTSFVSSEIAIVHWDGAGVANITATQAVGDGPVGVDLLERAGGGVYALTTGFNDDTYTITEIDAAGAVIASTTTDLPPECSQPAHGAWIGDSNESLIISCFGSDNLHVARRVQ